MSFNIETGVKRAWMKGRYNVHDDDNFVYRIELDEEDEDDCTLTGVEGVEEESDPLAAIPLPLLPVTPHLPSKIDAVKIPLPASKPTR